MICVNICLSSVICQCTLHGVLPTNDETMLTEYSTRPWVEIQSSVCLLKVLARDLNFPPRVVTW